MKWVCIQAMALSLVVGVASAGLAFVLATSQGLALEFNEAEAVVNIMEALTSEMGEGMSAEAGDVFYDYDAYGAELIPTAGFDRDSWNTAYGAVVAGYMATMSQEDFDAVFEEPLARLEAAALPDDQKQMIREHVDMLIADAQAMRLSGMVHADVVRPFEDRLFVLFHGAFGE